MIYWPDRRSLLWPHERRACIARFQRARRPARKRTGMARTKPTEGSPIVTPREIWNDKCEAARGVKENFGTENALTYLIGEKFLDFLDVAERHKDYQAEIPAFAAEIKDIFEQWEIADYLERARHREPFDPDDYEEDDEMDPEDIEMERKEDIRTAAKDLMLVEQAREWLLDEK
jgi:hypothetical protein